MLGSNLWSPLLAVCLLGAQTVSARPALKIRADVVEPEDVQCAYDYIIVGGGTAGLTVGDRLSQDGKYSVLVIEIGKFDFPRYVKGVTTFNITSEPQTELDNREIGVVAGIIVGGGSAINGQNLQIGTSHDHNIWSELSPTGAGSWNWPTIHSYLKKAFTHNDPPADVAEAYNITWDPSHWSNTGNPDQIDATYTGKLNPKVINYYNAMKQMPGVDLPIDGQGGQNGLYWFTVSMDPVTYNRSYSRSAHWEGISRNNYEMVINAKANRIILDENNTATGVQFIMRNDSSQPARRIKARKEVILAAGAIHTPQILQLSGIGPRDVLTAANIPVKVELPGVGQNFQDHHFVQGSEFYFNFTTEPPTPNVTVTGPDAGFGLGAGAFLGLPVVSPDRYLDISTRYAAQDPAAHLPAGTHPTVIAGYAAQQAIYARLMREKNFNFFIQMLPSTPNFSVQNVHPTSRGHVKINPADPEEEPLVDYRACTNPIDFDVMTENMRFLRRYMTEGFFAPYGAVEGAPGAVVQTDEQYKEWLRGKIYPSEFHPIGTAAKMPLALGGVVDEDLLVHGVKNLRVIDASIFPTIVGSTTSMTVYAVAERAADLIKAAQ